MLSLSILFLPLWIFGSNFVMAGRFPPGSWDSHIHVIDPARFPMDPDRDYTPKPATVANATQFQESRGIHHAVIVLPSVYARDNAVLLDALKQFGGRYRGVAVIDPDTVTNETLDEMHAAGVRGLRVNFGNGGDTAQILSLVHKNAEVARRYDWVLQVWLPISLFQDLHPIIPKLGVRVVADHFGHAEVGSKTNQTVNTIDPYKTKGFPEMIDLVRQGHLFVKLSAPYQNSKQAPLYEDLRVVAQAIIGAGPDMVVYGSDWPHTSSKEGNAAVGGRLNEQNYRDINDAALVEVLKDWAGSPTQIQKLFVDNPRRLWQWYTED
ncbi:amidohydrolase family protein [Thozetella sp. PMI_491]|nr:amidohydrolase family protein [Thozetella sp. PMI_491]